MECSAEEEDTAGVVDMTTSEKVVFLKKKKCLCKRKSG